MTHVELLNAEKNKYIKEGKELLDAAADWLHRNCDEWDVVHEQQYVALVQQAAANLNKAIAINDVLIKLGVFN